jgi:uncharacterized protein (DUF1499 family)
MNFRSPRTWSTCAAVLAALLLVGVAVTIAGSRNDLISYPTAFQTLGRIAIAAAIVGALALVSWFAAIKARSGGTLRAAVTLIGMAIMVGCFYLYQAAPPPGPFMNDITTDLDDPPEFIALLPLRPASSNSAEYGGAEVAANQRRVHPEVQPLLSTLAPGPAFDRAVTVAQDMGWEIVAQNRASGRIEAIDTTPFFRFKDDVVIRIRPDARGSRIDLRSHSRIGLTDLGKNASRIMNFLRAFPVRG